MISEKMVTLGTKKSVIREIFEYSKKRAAEIGAENVFDFSIGNPNVPAPVSVHETIKELLDSKNDYYLFGYTSAQGDADTRAAVAADLNKRFGTAFHADNFYMTCGAAASLRIVLGALTVPGDEYIVFTPYFPEYRVFIESAEARFILGNNGGSGRTGKACDIRSCFKVSSYIFRFMVIGGRNQISVHAVGSHFFAESS